MVVLMIIMDICMQTGDILADGLSVSTYNQVIPQTPCGHVNNVDNNMNDITEALCEVHKTSWLVSIG